MSILIPFDFRKGDRLDDMTIVTPIVQGGHGDLYLVQGNDGCNYALKVIRKADNEGELNGIEHCRSVSSHIPGLVPVLRTGRLANGRVWCVMPPADNMAKWPDYEPDTLAGRIRREGRIHPDEVLKTANVILETIRDLHEAGLAHCDIKPENIIFIDGKPKLTDYSLLLDTRDQSVDAPFGTIGFVPPEMSENRSSFEPMACDLYAVGKIIYNAWSGTDVIMFPSIPQDISLHEIGIIRPLYMKACSSTPNRRFKSANEFIAAVSDARSRLNHGLFGRWWQVSRSRLILFLILFLFLCATVFINIGFFVFFRPAGNAANDQTAVAPVPETLSYRGDPLIVTTASDVVDPNDGVNSLREAFNHAQRNGAGATVSFAGDFEIRLASPLKVSQNIIIDGEENRIVLTGPETEPMFQVSESRLTLKNLSLMSDRSGDGGGILDVDTPGRTDLISVRDGGKSETLWKMSGKFELNLDGDSQLHRFAGTKGASVKIMAGSSLEDASFAGNVPGDKLCDVYGLLKNASVDDGIIRPFNGGKCENIMVKCSTFDLRSSYEIHPKPGCAHHCTGGIIDGMKTEFGSVYAYKQGSVLTGTVSIGGAAVSTGHIDTPIVNAETDFIIDLTGRTESSTIYYTSLVGDFVYIVNDPISFPLIERLKDFAGARSYTIRIKEDQAPGVYNLAGDAEDFTTPFSLAVGDTVYPDALSVENSFSAGDRTCFLALQKKKKSPLGGTSYVLVLIIEAPSGEADTPAEEEGDVNGEETFVLFEGIIDGRGTFTFQNDKILYNHLEWNYPADVTINGKPWKNLNEPFELGVEPAFSTARIADKIGRDTIEFKTFQDRAELFIDDWEDSLARYRVFIRFKKTQDD